MTTPKSSRWLLTLLSLLGLMLTVAGPCAMPASAQDGSSRRDGGGEGRREGRGRFRRDSEERNRDEKPATPTPPSVAKPATKPASSSSGSSPSMDMNEYAKDLIKKYDKNSDLMLQADEQRELRGKAATADLDKDGTITREELVAHLSTPAAASSAPATTSTPATNNGESSKSESSGEDHNRGDDTGRGRRGDTDKRSADSKNLGNRVFTASALSGSSTKSEKSSKRSFRFTPPAERLPSGLPDWFTSKDKDKDGQVSMREYNRSWSERTAAEFRRYDLDNDGMITAKEAAKSKKGE